ncbi:P22 tailspike protein head-binding protein [Serratia proteamaculans]|uniref:phage tailspike protein n=1 Tax=Serratia proteamaculans TaxID=28151 RepID=UPI0009F7B0A3|nr:phage tailspike protein [Serratia proteamaculans]SMB38096.1 P22 tailspike protein head-binding protein [Serratia proteamaculans]
MNDIVSQNVVVSMPSQLFTLANSFGSVANGHIYIGKIDTDPTIESNQIQVYMESDSGNRVPVSQPIDINTGGYPVYSGQIARFITFSEHSMAVFDEGNTRQFYFPNVLNYGFNKFKSEVMDGLISLQGASKIGFEIEADYPKGTIGHVFSNLFKTCQYVQFYYDEIGNWDDAIFQAQLNIYLKGYSPKLVFPSGIIHLKRPILGAQALGDAIDAARPDLNFYNPVTGRYKSTWPTIIEGTYRKHYNAGTNPNAGTQIYLDLSNDKDLTYQNYGIIHVGPTEVEQFNQSAIIKKVWQGTCVIKDVNLSSYLTIPSQHPGWCHGIVSFNGAQNLIENVQVYNVWGAGILFDWCWDSKISNCLIMKSGRMMDRTDYAVSETDVIERQLYSAIQVMMSPRGSGTLPSASSDNSNFIRIYDCHIEDNYGTADIMARGQASPLWIENCHFEADGVAPGSSRKTAVALSAGITQFMGNPSLGWNENASNFGAYAYWYGGSMYANAYLYTGRIGRYSELSLENIRFPNINKILISSGNTPSKLSAVNSVLGDVQLSGGNAKDYPLSMTDCSANDITVSYVKGIRLTSCNIASLTVANNTATASSPSVLNGVIAGYISGVFSFAFGDVWLTSTTTVSDYNVENGTIRENFNSYAHYTDGYK